VSGLFSPQFTNKPHITNSARMPVGVPLLHGGCGRTLLRASLLFLRFTEVEIKHVGKYTRSHS